MAGTDLISKETVKEWLNSIGVYGYDYQVDELPSAERVGKWKFKTTDTYIQRICSACGWSERMYHRNRNQDGLIRNYCPNCGARMVNE